MTRLTPKAEALAFRIWAHCEPIGWNVTIREVSEALAVRANFAGKVVKSKGWGSRFRATGMDYVGRGGPISADNWALSTDDRSVVGAFQ